MSLPRPKFRELVFLILYRHHFLDQVEEEDDAFFYMETINTTKKNVLLAKAVVRDILKHRQELDAIIRKECSGYDLERIQSVEINILRLSLFEILYEAEVPGVVAISEGLRLAKKFSTSDAVAFVNGILDQVYKNKSNPVYTASS